VFKVSKGKKIAIGVIAVVLVLGIAFAVWLFLSGRGDPGDRYIGDTDIRYFDVVSNPFLITTSELYELHSAGYRHLITIGVIDPVRGAIPFSVASNPVSYSYLVWHSDYSMRGGPYAINQDLNWMRRPLREMEDLLSRGNITHDSFIVVYASDDMAQGSFVMWQLYMMGFNVRWLDGGNGSWNDAGHPTGSSARLNAGTPGAFSVPNYDWTVARADLEMVIYAAQNPSEWAIVDTRTWGEFAGTSFFGDGYGGGRIAGSYFITWTDAFIDGTDYLLSEFQLRQVFADVLDGRNVIVYCHGGIRSSHTWIALKSLGVNVFNYDGSWIEWSYAASDWGTAHPLRDTVRSLTEEWTDSGGRN